MRYLIVLHVITDPFITTRSAASTLPTQTGQEGLGWQDKGQGEVGEAPDLADAN